MELTYNSARVVACAAPLLLRNLHAAQALDGLEEYSHVWLMWAADRNGHDAVQSKVRAPKLRGGKAGLFATRSPFRPNPIGLSLVRLLSVDGDTLHRLATRIGLSGRARLIAGEPFGDTAAWLDAWAPEALNRDYRDGLARLSASSARLDGLPAGEAKLECFRLGGEMIHRLAKDPLLPEPFADVAARRAPDNHTTRQHSRFEERGRLGRDPRRREPRSLGSL